MTPYPLSDGVTYLNLDALLFVYDFGTYAVCHFQAGGGTLNLTGDDHDRLIALLVKNGGKATKNREHPETDPANVAKMQRGSGEAGSGQQGLPAIVAGDPRNSDPKFKGA